MLAVAYTGDEIRFCRLSLAGQALYQQRVSPRSVERLETFRLVCTHRYFASGPKEKTMPRILLEQFHLSVTVAGNLPDEQREALRKILLRRSFRLALQRALRTTQEQFPELKLVKYLLSV